MKPMNVIEHSTTIIQRPKWTVELVRPDYPTPAGLIYSFPLCSYMIEKCHDEGAIHGHLSMMGDFDGDLHPERFSHIVKNMRMESGRMVGDVYPSGHLGDLLYRFRRTSTIQFSLAGKGLVSYRNYNHYVDEDDFKLICIDAIVS